MGEADARPSDAASGARLVWLAAVVVAVAATIRLFLEYRDCGLLGWDTYPMIDLSRIGSPGDLLDVFRQSLMGKEEGGLYYRPLPKLTLAFDHALWGLWPPGYHLTSALFVGAAGLSVFAAAAELLRVSCPVGAITALVLLLVHPVLATVAPVPARRPDVLCLLFMALAVAAQARASRRQQPLPLLPAALAALAMASKETGFVLVGLSPLVAFVASEETGRLRRLRAAAIASVPMLVVVALALLVRVAILGGAVGDRPLQDEAPLVALLDMLERMGMGALSPGAAVGELELPTLLFGALAATALGAVLLATPGARREGARVAISAVVVSLAWIGFVVAIYTVGVILQPWYLLIPVAGFTLLVGGLVQGLLSLGRAGAAARAAAVAALACVALLVFQFGSHSPLFHGYDDWEEATHATDAYLAMIGRKVAGASPGDLVQAAYPPPSLPVRAGRLWGIAMLAPYSVEAWVRLSFPENSVRVVASAVEDASAAPDEILILLQRDEGGDRGQGR